jgi:hypothetical protein
MARRKKRKQLSGFGFDKDQMGKRLLCVGSNVAGGIAGKVVSDLLYEKVKYMMEEKTEGGTTVLVPKKGKVYVANGVVMLAGTLLAAFSREEYLQNIGAGMATAGAIEIAEAVKGDNNDAVLSGWEEEDGMGALPAVEKQFLYIEDGGRERILGQDFNDNVPGNVKFKKAVFTNDTPGQIVFQADQRAAK